MGRCWSSSNAKQEVSDLVSIPFPGYRREYFKWRMPYNNNVSWTMANPDYRAVPSEKDLEDAKIQFFIAAASKALNDGFKIEEIRNLESKFYGGQMYGIASIDVSAEILMRRYEPPKQKDRNRTW